MVREIDLKYFFLINFVLKSDSVPINMNLSKIAGKYEVDSHLNFEHVKNICSNSIAICKSNDSNVCATRLYNGRMEYKDYENSCFLFINNMCLNYGKEYSIISTGLCSDYFNNRRSDVKIDNKTSRTGVTKTAVTKTAVSLNTTKQVTKKSIKRSETTLSTLYEIDTAFDFHICPLSCPNVYSPVCVGVNRGHGLYYKFYTFVNHCSGDLYYCKNWREFSPPPDEEEMVKSSPLSWSYCAANRYIQFARFTEMTSSMGHYGWLAGDHNRAQGTEYFANVTCDGEDTKEIDRPTHIVEPHERVPGYGR